MRGPVLLDDLDLGMQEVELEPETSGDTPDDVTVRATYWDRWLTRWIPLTSGLTGTEYFLTDILLSRGEGVTSVQRKGMRL